MTRKRTGTFLGLPYDWRRPTLQRLRDEAFNREEPRFFVPKSYGWGYGINFYRLVHPFKRAS